MHIQFLSKHNNLAHNLEVKLKTAHINSLSNTPTTYTTLNNEYTHNTL